MENKLLSFLIKNYRFWEKTKTKTKNKKQKKNKKKKKKQTNIFWTILPLVCELQNTTNTHNGAYTPLRTQNERFIPIQSEII